MQGLASTDPDLTPKAGGLSPAADRIGDYGRSSFWGYRSFFFCLGCAGSTGGSHSCFSLLTLE